MRQIYIWGTGYHAQYVYSMIDKETNMVAGFIDSDEEKEGKLWEDRFMIYSPIQLKQLNYDYIVISILDYKPIEIYCTELEIPAEKVIAFWKDSDPNKIFRNRINGIFEEQRKTRIYENRLDSAPYEWGIKKTPQIYSAYRLLKKIIYDRTSLCRFGDGEFEIMRGKNRAWFQNKTETLKSRLLEVIQSYDDRINIAIAQNFQGLENYKEESADIIRDYMAFETREDILKLLDMNRIYYDAYVTRPYILYQDKRNAEMIFPLFKELWKNRSLIIIEGEYGRNGINNDLFDTADTIKRIICPFQNAWERYKEIERTALDIVQEDDLVCISLGPAATVLAYDLARKGYQAIDIGQVDNEYDWYIRGVEERIAIEDKMVAEYDKNTPQKDFNNQIYLSQIVARIR